jgi:small subunit ribosomal protein S2
MPTIDVASLPHKAPDYDLHDLLEVGAHFGHESRRWHPKMDQWIYGEKDGVHIFDLAKTAEQLAHAYNYAYQLGAEGKTLVFVGTKRQAREVIQSAAEGAGAMYITSRWLGGLLTNWPQVSKSLQRMIEIEDGLKSGKYEGYTKYERVQLEKEADRLARFFGGVRSLKKRPDALFVIDPNREKVVIKEAIVSDVPVIGLVDTNTDPRPIDLVVPANDDAVRSIEYFVKQIADGYAAGKKGK